MRRIQKAIESYYNWTFKSDQEHDSIFMLLCMVVGFALYVFGPPAFLPLAFLLVAAPGVHVLSRVLQRHPGDALIDALTPEYLNSFGAYFESEMKSRGVPEGMIVMDVGLLWVLKEAEDDRALFLHIQHLNTKLERIEHVSGSFSSLHEAELPAVQSSEGSSSSEGS